MRVSKIQEENSKKMETISCKKFLKENKDFQLLLSAKQIEAVLKKEGFVVDDEGFIRNKKRSERVLANDGGEIQLKEIGGILPGSKVFVKKNIAAFAQYFDEFGL